MTSTSRARVLALSGLAAVAIAGCGSAIKQVAGSSVPVASAKRLGNGVVDREDHPYVNCIRAAGLPVAQVGQETLQVGPLPAGPTIDFASDPPIAEGEQINVQKYPQAQGAEVIGAALLYVHAAPDAELKRLEGCLDQGVKG